VTLCSPCCCPYCCRLLTQACWWPQRPWELLLLLLGWVWLRPLLLLLTLPG